ncbi:30S ribosomal protein S8 [Candidatus Nanohalovita haloferacivicina]|uniref:30S ribosomal protein S8 n=1 Tax=Candidatus Nanohalovita haloferacivicina TaxID=2978046 RepID=UPI00325FBB30|nr:Ribosomal protein S8 [Candidatus Nanohalobia archaeon BNXNv]
MQQDTFSDAMSSINNAVDAGNKYATISPTSNLVKNLLLKLQELEYIGVFEYVEDGQGGKFRVEVKNHINECQSVKPRFSVQNEEYSKWAKRYLPAQGFGELLVTTSHGLMTHYEAREEGIGGKLLGYVY